MIVEDTATPVQAAAPAPAIAAVRSARALRLVLALLIAALWGASFPLTKVGMSYMGPMSLAFLRWLISALFLTAWIAGRGKLGAVRTLRRRDWLLLAGLAFSGVTLFYALENLALNYTSVTNTGILSNLTTVFMALLAAVWLKERLRLEEWLALGIAFTGAALISLGSGHVTITGPGLRGDLLMVAATVFAAIYSVGSKRLVARYPSDVITTLVSAVGALCLLPLALGEGLTLALPLPAWAALLVLGLAAGALANLWWLRLLSTMDASRAGMILLLIPIFSTALAVGWLHEALTPAMAVGGILVIGGVAIMQRR